MEAMGSFEVLQDMGCDYGLRDDTIYALGNYRWREYLRAIDVISRFDWFMDYLSSQRSAASSLRPTIATTSGGPGL
jgi:hypothetical protein